MLDILFGPSRKAVAEYEDGGDEGDYSGGGFGGILGRWLGGWGSGPKTRAGVRVDEEGALTLAAFFAACRILSTVGGMLPMQLHQRINGGSELAEEHSLFPILRTCWNPLDDDPLGASVARERGIVQQVAWGNTFAEIEWDIQDQYRRRRVVGLNPIHACRVQPVPLDWEAYRQGYRYRVLNHDGTATVLKPYEMLHVPGTMPDCGNWGRGVVAYGRENIGLGLAAEHYGAAYFGSGGQPKGLLKMDGLADPEKRRQFRKEWKEVHASPDAGEIAIVPTAADYHPFTESMEASQNLQTRKFSVSDVARYTGVPVYMLEEYEKAASFASVEQRGIDFVVYSLVSGWLHKWEEQCNLKLLLPSEQGKFYARHLVRALLRGDFKTRMDGHAIALRNGIRTINEVRSEEDWNSIGPDGDVHYVPLNMTTAKAMRESPLMPGAATTKPGAAEDDSSDAKKKDGEDGDGLKTLARAVLTNDLERWLAKERDGAAPLAKSADFATKLDAFHASRRTTLATRMASSAATLAACGVTITGDALAALVIARSRAALHAAYETDTRAAFAARLERWPDRAAEVAESLLTELLPSE